MNIWVKRLISPEGIGALMGLVGGIVAIYCVYLTQSYATGLQDRQAQLELITKFDASSNQVVELASEFLEALNASTDLSAPKKKIRDLTGKQLLEMEALKRTFGEPKQMSAYLGALEEFNLVAQKTNSPSDIRPWVDSFGSVIDSKTALTLSLYRSVGSRQKVQLAGKGRA